MADSLAKILDASTPRRHCSFARLYLMLPDDDRQAVTTAVESIKQHRQQHGSRSTSGPTAAWLARALQTQGHTMPVAQVNAHLADRCGCTR